MSIPRKFVGSVASLVMVVSLLPVTAGTAQAAPQGTLTGWCTGNAIYLEWGSHPNANSNGLQKGDMYPSDPNRYWDWLPTNSAQRSYTDTAVVPGVTYQYRVKYRPGLPSNVITVSCPAYVPAPTPVPVPALSCSSERPSVASGGSVLFTAYGGNGSYLWNEPGGSQYVSGSQVRIPLTNLGSAEQLQWVYVQSGSRGAWCNVWVSPAAVPATGLICYPPSVTVQSGEEVILRAWGGNGTYSWTSAEGSPSSGYGAHFATLFTNSTSSVRSYWVTVHSGLSVNTCEVRVAARVHAGTTPAPVPYTKLFAAQDGRNVSAGQTGAHARVTATGNDTVQFTVTVRNDSSVNLYSVRLTDVIPTGLNYVPGSATVNGVVAGDDVTASGHGLGTLAPGQKVIVRVAATISPAAVPAVGTRTVYNSVQVQADGGVYAFSHLPVILGLRPVLTSASAVKTGIGDATLISLIAALASAGIYGLYTRTNRFNRRYALARVRASMTDKNRLNFARLS